MNGYAILLNVKMLLRKDSFQHRSTYLYCQGNLSTSKYGSGPPPFKKKKKKTHIGDNSVMTLL